MKIYFAPLEGVATYTYRNTHNEMFGMCDEYFTPFMVPTESERITSKTLREVLKENNTAKIIPQVLCNDGAVFVKFIERLKFLGFDNVNLNFGCPSGTVVKKGRGSGFLKDPDGIDRFLDYIFSNTDIKISVKTRAGFNSHDEFDKLLEIFNKYPLSELIIHPRVREEYYNGAPNMETFEKAYKNSANPLCYNGNIYDVSDFEKIVGEYPDIESIMIGRGAIKNPAIFREIKGGERLKTEELVNFSKALEEKYLKLLGAEHYTLHKLKEIWLHMILNFPEEKKIAKAIKKANKLNELNGAINCLPML